MIRGIGSSTVAGPYQFCETIACIVPDPAVRVTNEISIIKIYVELELKWTQHRSPAEGLPICT